MASNINYTGINENFPVPGKDNDTQVFRDNFDTIKNSLRNAKDEIEDLQDNVVRSDSVNDLNLSEISNALLVNNRDQKYDYGNEVTIGSAIVDYQNAPYQIYRLGSDTEFTFLNLPGDPSMTPAAARNIGVGKVTLELYADDENTVVATGIQSGVKYSILSIGTTDFTLIGADSNTVGIVFTASETGTGSGVVQAVREVIFADPGSGNVIKKISGFPSPFYVSSPNNPKFVEVWRHRANEIFMRYLGEASE
jgi:hypothetical protein